MSEASTSGEPPNFNRLAHIYRWGELLSFGPFLHRCRCAFLDRLSDRRRALVLGDGDGRFTVRLLRENPEIRIDAVDASSTMLEKLFRSAGVNARRIRTCCADARRWRPVGPPYDLVVSHFFLDCLTQEEAQTLAETLRGSVTLSARWLISEFAVPPNRFGRFFARPLIHGLYRAFGLLTGLKVRTLPDHRAALRLSGFELAAQRQWLGGLLVSELWTVNRN
jgi:ubiquinone/menaquinone biosynthesis C-methylase UbiE